LKVKSLLAAAAIAAAFTMPAHAAKKPVAQPAAINVKAALARAKNAIAYTMKDPESVRWRQAKVAPNGNVCIEVNAKNSYGGYVGFEPYFYNARTGDVLNNDGWIAAMWCRQSVTMPKGTVAVNAR
jgi:hypothetical protein